MPAIRTHPAKFFGSQIGAETRNPLTYTGSPRQLLAYDIKLFLRNIFYLPFIFLPPHPWPNGSMDELYPTVGNIRDITLHAILVVGQLSFLTSLPFLLYLPVPLLTSYIGVFLGVNFLLCRLINGSIPEDGLKSTEDEYSRSWPSHDDEYWIFLNGICVGQHWLQNNIDRLSRTFHRQVVGVHNQTAGVIFDFVQCLIQRSFLYATQDIRDCYVLVKKALYRQGTKKVVLILHSQGGIEGSMIIDWLLNELPQDLLNNLEVYTFGCIANHFNNPYRNSTASAAATAYSENSAVNIGFPLQRAISHVEHYANAYDFASRWGILHYTRTIPKSRFENRFMGRVLVNPRAGHQFNQHYLGTIFPLDPSRRFVRDPIQGDFMNMDVDAAQDNDSNIMREGKVLSLQATRLNSSIWGGRNDDNGQRDMAQTAEMLNVTPTSPLLRTNPEVTRTNGEYSLNDSARSKMWELSRLWLYRNGGSP